MEYTKNYHLPQWKKEDRIMMEDFNQMCADMEEGLSSNREAARQEAEEAAKPPYVVGSYYGANADMTFDIGFRPSFLIISGAVCHSAYNACSAEYVTITRGNTQSEAVTFTDTGFILHKTEARFPDLLNGHNYDYIAFR